MNIIVGEIRVKRGLKANLPVLKEGEPAYCTDTKEYYIGTPEGNVLVGSQTSGGDTGGGGSVPSNVILFEDWTEGETVTIDTSTATTNTAPSVSSTFNLTSANDSTSISIPYNISDAQGGNMTATLTKDGVATTQTVQTGANTWNVGLLAVGSHTLKISVTDSGGLVSNELTFNLTVTATETPTTNTAPSITSSYNTTSVNDSSSVSIPYTVSDAEGGSFTATYTKDGVTSTATISAGANTWNVGTLTVGDHVLKIKVVDSGGLTSTELTFNINVTATPDTTVPVLTITPAQTFTDQMTVNMSATDSGGGTPTIYYTLDDSDPKTSATKIEYTGPLTLTETDTIKAYAVDNANNASAVQTVTYTKQTAVNYNVVYPENGYLVMPPSQYTWAALTGQSDASYIRMASNVALTALFDQSLPDPFKFDNLPFVTYSATHTVDYNENVSIATGSNLGKMAIKLSTSRGADATALNTYLQTTDKKLSIKLATGYKTLNITPNISTVTTRTSGVDTVNFEYVKFVLNDGIGDYVPTSTLANKFFASNGYTVSITTDYVFSRTYKNLRVNSDGTVEMLLPKGTLASIDAAGVSAYLSAANLKIYYV